MRLSKYLAECGVASRRRAEEIIVAGRVCVGGRLTRLPQTKVEEGDVVTLDGRVICPEEQKVYLLLNKPPGYITTVRDPQGRPTVLDLVGKTGFRLFPIGRLDADTSGILLLTNDGKLANYLTHPRFEIEKVYRAQVRGLPGKAAIEKLREGLVIEGEKTAPAQVRITNTTPDGQSTVLLLTLTEGRKRQVKKMCLAIGCPVLKLERISFAGLTVAGMPEGSWRYLDSTEKKLLLSHCRD